MRINSTSGHKFDTGNAFSDIDFLYDVESLAVRRCLSSFTAHAQFRHITTLLGLYFQFKI